MVYERLLKHRPGFFVLLDPDRIPRSTVREITRTICDSNLTAILVGTSLLYSVDFNDFLKAVKDNSTVPVIIFPGGARQLSPHADALFFLSLVSGRNPELLIGEHVRAAPLIKHYGLEVIPVGYILIESGSMTSVEFMSDTKPIPRDKPEIVAAHALASEYLGMKLIYLEAGSGGSTMVGEGIITQVRKATTLPLIVGGGIRTPRDADKRLKAGADFFVIGNALEADYRKVKGFSRIFEK
jgi:phosphoglycerol geranylgeranyltransferase